jgi:hypothetical protein
MSRLEHWIHDRGVPWLFALCALSFCLLGVSRLARSQDFDSWLVLVVDVSGSVSGEEYLVQQSGYVEVLGDPMIQAALDRTAVSIVEFSTAAVVVVEWMDVRSAGAVYQAHVRAGAGNTCVFCGLEAALALLDGKSGRRVIDVSGDGWENMKSTEDVHRLRDLATVAGVEINTLALLVEPDQTATFGGYGGAVDQSKQALEKWYADLATGFAMAIETLDDLARALRRKLFSEVASNVR